MNQDVAGRLQGLIEKLRAQTGASRTTVRGRAGDDPVALLAESLAPGVESMADGQQPTAILAAPTYVVLSSLQKIIVQNDCRTEAPQPPRSLIERYRVYAQMLAPVLSGDEMIAAISVHQQDATRQWTKADVAALEEATAAVTALLANGAGR
jgi:GAF domain-containing protein